MAEIIMKTIAAGADWTATPGQKVTVSDAEASELVKGGYAVYAEKNKLSGIETATLPQTENAATRIGIEQLQALPGGWYLLPDGQKIRGKEAALKALGGGAVNGAQTDNTAGGGTDQPDGGENTPQG